MNGVFKGQPLAGLPEFYTDVCVHLRSCKKQLAWLVGDRQKFTFWAKIYAQLVDQRSSGSAFSSA